MWIISFDSSIIIGKATKKVARRTHIGVVVLTVAPFELLEQSIGRLLDQKQIVAGDGISDVRAIMLVPRSRPLTRGIAVRSIPTRGTCWSGWVGCGEA